MAARRGLGKIDARLCMGKRTRNAGCWAAASHRGSGRTGHCGVKVQRVPLGRSWEGSAAFGTVAAVDECDDYASGF